MTPAQFASVVESFLSETGRKPTQFGRDAVNDPNFVFDVRAGRVPTLSVASRVLDFINTKRCQPTEPAKEAAA